MNNFLLLHLPPSPVFPLLCPLQNILLVNGNLANGGSGVVDTSNIKLADFGFAKHVEDLAGDRLLCGTVGIVWDDDKVPASRVLDRLNS